MLEAITGTPFPTGTGICARFVTKITVQSPPDATNNDAKTLSIRIEPSNSHKTRTKSRRQELEDYRSKLITLNGRTHREERYELQKVLDEATRFLLSDSPQDRLDVDYVTDDIIHVTISDPLARNLAIIDLPGLIDFDDNSGLKAKIEIMTIGQIKRPECLVLPILSAWMDTMDDSEKEIQAIVKGVGMDVLQRCLRVIIHPNTAEILDSKRNTHNADGQSAKTYVSNSWVDGFIQSKENLGQYRPHNLMLTDEEGPDDPTQCVHERRVQREQEFFDKPPWNKIDRDQLGTMQLQKRLNEWQLQKWEEHAPTLQAALESRISELRSHLDTEVGMISRLQPFRQMLEHLKSEAALTAAGVYMNVESARPSQTKEGPIYLRARITEQENLFRDDMMRYGRVRESRVAPHVFSYTHKPFTPTISEAQPEREEWKQWEDLKWNTQAEEIEYFSKKYTEALGGQEGRQQFNANPISSFFKSLSHHWEDITRYHVNAAITITKNWLREGIIVCLEKVERRLAADARKTRHEFVGFPHHKVLAERFYNQLLAGHLDGRRLAAEAELWELSQDLDNILVDNDPRSIEHQRRMKADQRFTESRQGQLRQSESARIPGGGADILDADRQAVDEDRATSEQMFLKHAYLQMSTAYNHYELQRQVWSTNVIHQVLERRIFRNLDSLVYKATGHLQDGDIEELLVSTLDRLQAANLRKELEQLEEDLELVKTIQSPLSIL